MGFLVETCCRLLLVALAVALAAGTLAAAVPCTGACANALFPSFMTATVCAEASATLTANGATPPPPGSALVGTGVYSAATDLEVAAVHAGLAQHGQVVTLAVYWAGARTAFWGSRRFGLTSAFAVAGPGVGATAGYGFFLSNVTGACPAALVNATVTPVLLARSTRPATCTATDVIGAGYYHHSSDLSCVFDIESASSALSPASTALVFVHDIGFRRAFFPTAVASSTTYGLSVTGHAYVSVGSGARALAVTSAASPSPPAEHATATSTFAVRVDLTNQSLLLLAPSPSQQQQQPTVSPALGRIFGTNPFYSANSSVAVAAWHAGCAVPGVVTTCFVTPQPAATRFYASGQNTVESGYLNLLGAPAAASTGGYSISTRAALAPVAANSPNGATTRVFLAMDAVIRSSVPLVGAGAYAAHSDVQKAVFHSGTRTLFESGDVYVHELPAAVAPPMLFGLARQGVASTPLLAVVAGADTVVVLSLSAAVPAVYKNETRILVQPRMWVPFSVVGCGVYHAASTTDFHSAVLHAGLATFGERAYVYVTFVGARSRFHASTNGVFVSQGGALFTGGAAAFALTNFSTRGYLPADPVYVASTDLKRIGRVVGTGYYTADSDLSGVAIHARLVPWQSSPRLLYIYTLPASRRHFLASTSNQIASAYEAHAAPQDAVVLSPAPALSAAAVAALTPSDPAVAPMEVNITHEYLLVAAAAAGRAVGACVYQAAAGMS